MVMMFVNTTNYIQGRDDGASVERDLCQRNDSDEDAHDNLQRIRIAFGLQNIRSNGILDTVTEHEQTNHGQACVHQILRKLDKPSN